MFSGPSRPPGGPSRPPGGPSRPPGGSSPGLVAMAYTVQEPNPREHDEPPATRRARFDAARPAAADGPADRRTAAGRVRGPDEPHDRAGRHPDHPGGPWRHAHPPRRAGRTVPPRNHLVLPRRVVRGRLARNRAGPDGQPGGPDRIPGLLARLPARPPAPLPRP